MKKTQEQLEKLREVAEASLTKTEELQIDVFLTY